MCIFNINNGTHHAETQILGHVNEPQNATADREMNEEKLLLK